ncbi:hypothetical protein EVAR_48179_1 [Eumeta japonica]|uniref:Uncharacterized protein n=1 Tax=Eumeta variegata TaxID=151549 RepID=A0A4C1XUY0_EUMVA|nr:hypothetical protein EVAR_48179_1 [Eumeta japonica]
MPSTCPARDAAAAGRRHVLMKLVNAMRHMGRSSSRISQETHFNTTAASTVPAQAQLTSSASELPAIVISIAANAVNPPRRPLGEKHVITVRNRGARGGRFAADGGRPTKCAVSRDVGGAERECRT